MLRTILPLLLWASGLYCFAQTPADSVSIYKREALHSRISEELNLNPSQQTQLAQTLLERSNAIKAVTVQGVSRQTALNQINSTAIGQMQAYLTAEQMALYHELQSKLKADRQQHGVVLEDEEMDF
jgi:hypothetical protein